MKCPFCKNDNTVLMVEVVTDDCTRICFECTNCGLRSSGAEERSANKQTVVSEEQYEDESLALQLWNEMSEALEKVWPK